MSYYVALFIPNADYEILTTLDGFHHVVGVFNNVYDAVEKVKAQFEDDEKLVDFRIYDGAIYIETTYGSYKIEEV